MRAKLKFSKYIWFVIALFLLALLLRTVGLSEFPNAIGRDEVYLGYNAYSLLQTGKDINGNFLPIFIESFLYTPAGYAYFSIPFIKILGLNVFSIRLASALFGALTIPLLAFLVQLLLRAYKGHSLDEKSVLIASLLSAFLLAIVPWHINLSRTASVTTVVVFFVILGTYLFTKWITTDKKLYLISSYVSFLFSMFFYISVYSFLPFFIIILFLSLTGRKVKKRLTLFVPFYLLLIIPIVITYLSPTLSVRVKSLSLTNSASLPIILLENAGRDGVMAIPPLVTRAFHNKVSVVSDMFLNNYFKHFSYDFLFRDGALPDRYRVPEVGLLYPVLIVFFIAGLYFLAREDGNLKWLLIGWILISPIGSGFASDDVPNMQRILFMLPPLVIVISYGFVMLSKKINSSIAVKAFFSLCIIALTYEAIIYMHQYYIHENAYRPWYRQEGYKELNLKLNIYKKNYSKVVVTNRESAPTLFLLFFNSYSPSKFQEVVRTVNLKDTDRISFDKYEISQEECPMRIVVDPQDNSKIFIGEKNTLYVDSGLCELKDFPKNVTLIDTIKRSDGSKVFYILAIKDK